MPQRPAESGPLAAAKSHRSAVSSNWGISSINDESKINSDAGGSQPDYDSDFDKREHIPDVDINQLNNNCQQYVRYNPQIAESYYAQQ